MPGETNVCCVLWLFDSGWGLRCVNDIPAGGFVCIYAGQLLNDEGANQVYSVLPSTAFPAVMVTVAMFARQRLLFSCLEHCILGLLNLNEPLDPFPFGVAAEQKGGQGWG